MHYLKPNPILKSKTLVPNFFSAKLGILLGLINSLSTNIYNLQLELETPHPHPQKNPPQKTLTFPAKLL